MENIIPLFSEGPILAYPISFKKGYVVHRHYKAPGDAQYGFYFMDLL